MEVDKALEVMFLRYWASPEIDDEMGEAITTLRAYHAQVQAVAGEMRDAVSRDAPFVRSDRVREWADRLETIDERK